MYGEEIIMKGLSDFFSPSVTDMTCSTLNQCPISCAIRRRLRLYSISESYDHQGILEYVDHHIISHTVQFPQQQTFAFRFQLTSIGRAEAYRIVASLGVNTYDCTHSTLSFVEGEWVGGGLHGPIATRTHSSTETGLRRSWTGVGLGKGLLAPSSSDAAIYRALTSEK